VQFGRLGPPVPSAVAYDRPVRRKRHLVSAVVLRLPGQVDVQPGEGSAPALVRGPPLVFVLAVTTQYVGDAQRLQRVIDLVIDAFDTAVFFDRDRKVVLEDEEVIAEKQSGFFTALLGLLSAALIVQGTEHILVKPLWARWLIVAFFALGVMASAVAILLIARAARGWTRSQADVTGPAFHARTTKEIEK